MKEFISLIVIPLIILTPVSAVASEAEDTGTIHVESNPEGVKLKLNKYEVGETPMTLIMLEHGKYKLIGELKGYKDAKYEVELGAGEKIDVTFDMEKGGSKGIYKTVMIIALLSPLVAAGIYYLVAIALHD